MSPRRTGLHDFIGRRRGVRVAGRHQLRAQAAARHKRRPDQYRGEKLALGAVLLPLLLVAAINLAMEIGGSRWQNGVDSDLPLALSTPLYYHHHRLILGDDGRKLAKSSGDHSLRMLRESGSSAQDIRSMVGLG